MLIWQAWKFAFFYFYVILGNVRLASIFLEIILPLVLRHLMGYQEAVFFYRGRKYLTMLHTIYFYINQNITRSGEQ